MKRKSTIKMKFLNLLNKCKMQKEVNVIQKSQRFLKKS